MNNVTGFQRARRLAAEKAAQSNDNDIDNTKVTKTNESATDGKNEGFTPLNDPPGSLSVDDVNSLRIEEVKKHLDRLGVKYSHNTGETKLREKLTDAINR